MNLFTKFVPKTVLFGLLVILAGIIIVAILKTWNPPTELEKAWLRQPVEQDATERQWRDIVFEKVAATAGNLVDPSSVRPYEDEDFLVTDYGDMTLKRFRYNGEQTAVYGKGEDEAREKCLL